MCFTCHSELWVLCAKRAMRGFIRSSRITGVSEAETPGAAYVVLDEIKFHKLASAPLPQASPYTTHYQTDTHPTQCSNPATCMIYTIHESHGEPLHQKHSRRRQLRQTQSQTSGAQSQ
jgi:hypothetical protein